MVFDNDETDEKRLKLQLRLAQLSQHEECRENFLAFVRAVWPQFISGRHLEIIAEKFERVARGELKRLIINMAPRHGKSEFASYLFPAWMVGKNPRMKIIQAMHNTDLSVTFGRKVKNLVDTDLYQSIFPDVSLAVDSKASGRWGTNHGGEYYASGVGSGIAGRGADLFIIDDPHSEQTVKSDASFEDVWEWYLTGPRQRLQPNASVILVQTRWSERDLTAKLLRAQARDPMADQWEVIELPAIFEDGSFCWPEFWDDKLILATKASITPAKWNAQYQQNPTGDENAIIPRAWWKKWEPDKPPKIEHIIQSYDTAFSKKETANYSAITTWGVFFTQDGAGPPNIILLDSKKGRWDFPELKKIALEEYKDWNPDTVIIEAKATGMPLTQELRKIGIPVVNYTPTRGNDKVTRVHSIAPLFESGAVWYPDRTWADELIEEVAAFPNGQYDDLVDSMTQALMRYRSGNFVILSDDDIEEEKDNHFVKVVEYY